MNISNYFVFDLSVLDAIRQYVRLGLDPGGFGKALLVQDEELARHKAHQNLLKDQGKPRDVVADMLAFVAQEIPLLARGSSNDLERWMAHNGLSGKLPCNQWDMMLIEKKLSNNLIWWEESI
jgi:hypothetical protein